MLAIVCRATCRGRTGSYQGAQQIEQWGVGIGKIPRKAISLQQQKALHFGVGFCFSHQARFPNSCFATNQDNMSLSLFCLLNESLQGGKLASSPNQRWTDDWRSDNFSHRFSFSPEPLDSPSLVSCYSPYLIMISPMSQ